MFKTVILYGCILNSDNVSLKLLLINNVTVQFLSESKNNLEKCYHLAYS